MNASADLRGIMKIRAYGFFWYKTVVSLSFPTNQAQGQKQQGFLTIFRPRALGNTLKIPLDRVDNMPTCMFSSLKDERRCQFTVCYGSFRRCVTLRAPTPAIYKAWWSALETAFMTVRLMQMSRALATNFDVLPEPEPVLESDNHFEDIVALNTRMDNVPILQDLCPTSAHDNDRESWQSSESPDEIVIIRSATPESTTNIKRINGNRAEKCAMPPDNQPSSGDSSSNTSSASLSSLISSDVLDCLSSDARELMDSCSSTNSYNADSTAVNYPPKNFHELLEDLLSRPVSNGINVAHEKRFRSFHPLYNAFSSSYGHGYKSHHSNSGESNTVSTAQLTDMTMAPEDVVPAVETEEVTTRLVFEHPPCSMSTPFQRLLLRQQSRAVTNDTRMVGNAVATPACKIRPNDGVIATKSQGSDSDNSTNNYSDCRQGWNHGVSRNRCRSRADAGGRQPQHLVTGRINKVRVQEIEQFASQRVQGSACTPKKPIVIKRITQAWTDVARFVFRPNADIDHEVNKYRCQRTADRCRSSHEHGNTAF